MLKFRGATPLSSKDLEAHTLHCKPIFEPSLYIILGKTPSQVGCALASHGHSIARLARTKFREATPFKGRNMVFRKVGFVDMIADLNLGG